MKKFLLVICFLTTTLIGQGQIFSPQLQGTAGVFDIYYPYGFYRGNVYNGYANGEGFFYWNDGTVFRGNYMMGIANGQGILITYQGYITGCWNSGTYVGQCQAPTMYSYNTVMPTLQNVRNNIPQNNPSNSYQPISTNQYTVTQIDPNTEMGRRALGRH